MATEADLAYWAAQANAALEQMGVAASATARHNAEDVVVVPDAEMDREATALLIPALEIRGFTVLSDTRKKNIRIDATSDSLRHDFNEEASR